MILYMDVECVTSHKHVNPFLWLVYSFILCYLHRSFIGASLSQPHTSGTALWKCVCIRMCLFACLRPYTVNFKCALKYFPKIECPRALDVKGNAGLLPECSVDNRSVNSSSLTPMVPYILFVTAPTDRPSTADYSQTVQNYTRWVGDHFR